MQIAMFVLMLALNLATAYIGVTALFLFKRRRPYPKAAPRTRFAVIIPARNEEKVIGNLVRALRAQNYPQEMIDIFVASNNCTDRTEQVALEAGAKIIACTGAITCKGDVLHQAFERLMPMDHDAFCIFDADNIPDPNFMQAMNDALCAGERVCKGRLKSGNAFESWVSGGYGLYHALLEWTYSRAHSAMGFSSNLVGTAFVAHREVMQQLGGWNTKSICEDTEFAVQCTRLGHRVAWVYEAMSYDEQVTKFGVSLRQRHRWCRGMVQCAQMYLKSMFGSDCPKKGMARDFGVLLLSSHTAPLAFLAMIVFLPFQPKWMLLLSAAGMVLALLGMMLLAVALCVLGGYPVKRMWKTIVMFPVFMVSWIPVQMAGLLIPVKKWTPIDHNGQKGAEELSKFRT